MCCRVAAKATLYWKKVKQTEFTRKVDCRTSILPNGELHGYMNPANTDYYYYYNRGILTEGCLLYQTRWYSQRSKKYKYHVYISDAHIMMGQNSICMYNTEHNLQIGINWCEICKGLAYYAIYNDQFNHRGSLDCIACKRYMFNE